METEDLAAFLSRFESDTFVLAAAEKVGFAPGQCRFLIEMFANEARTYTPIVEQRIKPDMKVLEIGSGLGFVSLWLARRNVNVKQLEPTAGPFDVFAKLATEIAACSGRVPPDRLTIGAEDLDPAQHGTFDFLFSFNVLEHVADLDRAMAAMATVLVPGGTMLHCCPNYTFPYEPHLNIPLVPFAPTLTKRLFPARITAQKLVWDSLNFVTARRLRRLAHRNGLEIELVRGQMAGQIERLIADPIFSARHLGNASGKAIGAVLRAARSMGLLALLSQVPPDLLTPMTAIFRKPMVTS
ncbi:class I SAM-dependent methyltransferase [Bradyrhizobium sp. 23]|uniref:class I SAM-dependent methyltransferase n=1 Tax=Bradyrhizobium sp. 23 TaxID=2782667 RepID=UPI001FFC26BC|nr:class I SAM-dependent methyltransferase [Bradyrhizobium sp. 23]MCK1313397.1 class I SAM-dependent methyltransferase [Bradyrhizobium sp. 23]